jgi:hypothetical protein
LTSFFEEIFQKATPLQYLAISEMLNVQYKRNLLNNLKRKYKIVGSELEPIFERQFLNISAFYNSLSIIEPQPPQNHRNNPNQPNNPINYNPNNARRPIDQEHMMPGVLDEGSDSE